MAWGVGVGRGPLSPGGLALGAEGRGPGRASGRPVCRAVPGPCHGLG